MLTLRLCLIDSLESSIDVLWEWYDREFLRPRSI